MKHLAALVLLTVAACVSRPAMSAPLSQPPASASRLLTLGFGYSAGMVRVTPNGKQVIQWRNIGTPTELNWWDVATGELVREIHPDPSYDAMDLSPDGHTLAMARQTGTMTAIDFLSAETGGLVKRINIGPTASQPTDLRFSARGDRMLVTFDDNSNRLFDLSGRLLASTPADQLNNWAVAPSYTADLAECARIVSPQVDGTATPVIEIENLLTGATIFTQTVSGNLPTAIALSPTGSELNLWQDGNVVEWSIKPPHLLHRYPVDNWENAGRVFKYAPGGKIAAVAGTQESIFLIAISTGKVVHVLENGVYDSQHIDDLSFSRDGTLLSSTDDDGIVQLWDVRTGRRVRMFNERTDPANCVAYSPDGSKIASGTVGGAVCVWDARRGSLLYACHDPNATMTSGVAFSNDGRWLASTAWNGSVDIRNAQTGRLLHIVRRGLDQGWVDSVAFSPDDRTLAGGGNQGHVYLWNVGTGKPEGIIQPLSDSEALSIAYSPDGRYLASESAGKSVTVWNAATHKLVAQLNDTHQMTSEEAVAFSSDGAMLIVGGDDYATFWSTKDWQKIKTLTPRYNTGMTSSVAIDRTGRYAASSGAGMGCTVWNVDTGKIAQFMDDALLDAVAFSPDGQHLACGSKNGEVQIFDFKSGKELADFGYIPTGQSATGGDWYISLPHSSIMTGSQDIGKYVRWKIGARVFKDAAWTRWANQPEKIKAALTAK